MKPEHPAMITIYLTVFIVLIALTLATTAIAYLDLGGYLNLAVALTIAIFKATLVILYFMHVRYSRPLTWVFVGAGFFWFVTMLVLTMSDVLTRDLPRLGGM